MKTGSKSDRAKNTLGVFLGYFVNTPKKEQNRNCLVIRTFAFFCFNKEQGSCSMVSTNIFLFSLV